ncbi:MAG: hypothetical protein HY443_00865 [Candidatus Nealsonbacteria bacterium]|nr:hypothetical protein [Candidatus Nealsonbacteria bacterium]
MSELDKKTAQKFLKIPGEARGVILKTDGEFILREKGKEGLEKLEKELAALGCPIKYREIGAMGFYPLGWRIVSLLAIQKVFGFDDQKFREMGSAAPKVSLVIKLFMQYFLSLQSTFGQTSRMWKKHYTIGSLMPVELNEKTKTIILRLQGFDLHPVFCAYLCGYFAEIIKIVVKKISSCQETKCFFRGEKYHEYLFRW